MDRPVLMAVDDDPAALRPVQEELTKRYGTDYDVRCLTSAEEALGDLARVRAAGGEVALVLADQWMPGMTGVEFLDRVRALHPEARRSVLITWHDRSTAPVLPVSVLRQIDWVTKPWQPGDEHFHQAIGQFLYQWALPNRPRFLAARVVGERWTARSHEIRDLLSRNSVAYGFHDVASEEGRALLREVGRPAARLPVVVLFDGRVLEDPSGLEIADALGVRTRPDPRPHDVTVVGAGPAGLAAAVYGASEGLRTVVLEAEAMGGQAGTSSLIRNYLGFPRGIPGADLAQRAYEQAWLLGAEFVYGPRAVGLETSGDGLVVSLSDGSAVTSRAVVLATGVTYRRLGVPSLDALVGAGVFYGAAAPEAQAMAGEEVYVVGGANSAGQAALHLARYARRVTLLVRGASLAATMSDYLVREIDAAANVTVRHGAEAVGGSGEGRLTHLVVRDRDGGDTETVPAAGLFVLIGAEPHTDWLPGAIDRDGTGHVLTGADRRGGPAGGEVREFETSVPGVFAVGDVRHGSVKRVASAVGEGAVAIRMVHDHLGRLRGPHPGR
ncbi:FAD-dependent oxidoreductase [Geodermatophilus sp. SYSU D00867]